MEPDIPNPAKTPTKVPQWGFYGTMVEYDTAIACRALSLAMNTIRATTCLSYNTCRMFLESRHGRHFADAVLDKLYQGCSLAQAIQLTVDSWMTYTISRDASRQYGIPVGLPYLTGFALSLEIEDENKT